MMTVNEVSKLTGVSIRTLQASGGVHGGRVPAV